jgi:hypothetical protein
MLDLFNQGDMGKNKVKRMKWVLIIRICDDQSSEDKV